MPRLCCAAQCLLQLPGGGTARSALRLGHAREPIALPRLHHVLHKLQSQCADAPRQVSTREAVGVSTAKKLKLTWGVPGSNSIFGL